MKKFLIGDKVKHQDEAISGMIISIEKNHAIVDTDEGFEEKISISKLILDKNFEININTIEEKNIESYLEQRIEKVHELDLHIEKIDFQWKNIAKEKILDRQIASFHEEMINSKRNGIDRLIIIHGKGKGILKNAILFEILKYKNIEYYESQISHMKNAAIEVKFIKQKTDK